MDCADYDATKRIPIEYYMVLRRWHNIYPAYEFRCFAKDAKLIGKFTVLLNPDEIMIIDQIYDRAS